MVRGVAREGSKNSATGAGHNSIISYKAFKGYFKTNSFFF